MFKPFYFLLLVFLFHPEAGATTFGPFPLVGQIENSPYIVRGKATAQRVALDRATQKPHTYWDFTVMEQLRGENIGSTMVIRQPGGEIGEIGYRLAGTANFRQNEEVVLMLRGTSEANIYDVVGYSSGKYTVKSGGAVLENAVGFPATNARGKPLSLDEFRAFVARVNTRDTTLEDRAVILNNTKDYHGHDESAMMPPPNSQQESFSQESTSPEKKPVSQENSIQSSPNPTEESSKGQSVGWWIFLALGGFIFVAAWFFFRRS